jgi:hypothetical protein
MHLTITVRKVIMVLLWADVPNLYNWNNGKFFTTTKKQSAMNRGTYPVPVPRILSFFFLSGWAASPPLVCGADITSLKGLIGTCLNRIWYIYIYQKGKIMISLGNVSKHFSLLPGLDYRYLHCGSHFKCFVSYIKKISLYSY